MEIKISQSKKGGGKVTRLKTYPYLFTGEELLKNPIIKIPCLWKPFFIKQGLIALTGGSDLGKSSLLRQFALSIALKETSFLGSPLNVRYGRALYLATEDNEITAKFSLQNAICKSVKPDELKDLCYLINPDNPLKAIEEQLRNARTDVVIIDSFGDVFNGNLNDNNAVRTTLNKYQKLSEKYDTLFIFLHHTGKRTENNNPSKNNIIGSQGFEAKMRLVMELRRPDSSQKRILHFTKGNYLPDSIKNNPLELFFNDKQQFHFVGNSSGNKINARFFSKEQKATILKIAEPLKKEGFSYKKILVKLEENSEIDKLPSRNTLVKMLEETK
jgi:predicted ATP-dependent serine protease